jgi:hypothetical protein
VAVFGEKALFIWREITRFDLGFDEYGADKFTAFETDSTSFGSTLLWAETNVVAFARLVCFPRGCRVLVTAFDLMNLCQTRLSSLKPKRVPLKGQSSLLGDCALGLFRFVRSELAGFTRSDTCRSPPIIRAAAETHE